jgi:hypothetical protein
MSHEDHPGLPSNTVVRLKDLRDEELNGDIKPWREKRLKANLVPLFKMLKGSITDHSSKDQWGLKLWVFTNSLNYMRLLLSTKDFLVFGNMGVWTQGLELASQHSTPWAITPAVLALIIFKIGSGTYGLDQPWLWSSCLCFLHSWDDKGMPKYTVVPSHELFA